MKRRLAFSLLLLSLLGPAGGVWAQGYWRDLPPDERRQMRQQMREHWQQERELRREDGVAPRWRDLPVEDRRRLRDDMREQRAWQDQRGQRAWPEQREQRAWGNPPREGRGERGWRRD